jgi:hypothetical protein
MTEEDQDGDDLDGEMFTKLLMTPSRYSRRSLAELQAAEERGHKRHYFMKWLQEAGVITFLDSLMIDSGTTPEAQQRAKELHDRLVAPVAG